MKSRIFDGKSWYGYPFWNAINRLVVGFQFKSLEISGKDKLPKDKPFILVANHTSRWDGLVVQYLLDRKANYMVSPNEMTGIQRPAVLSVGAFPANPRLDIVGYATRQLTRGEPVVVFPEGNVFYDGSLRRFKSGTAKIALNANEKGLNVEIFPVAINYSFGKFSSLFVQVGDSIHTSIFSRDNQKEYREKVNTLTSHMHLEVSELLSQTKTLFNSTHNYVCS